MRLNREIILDLVGDESFTVGKRVFHPNCEGASRAVHRNAVTKGRAMLLHYRRACRANE